MKNFLKIVSFLTILVATAFFFYNLGQGGKSPSPISLPNITKKTPLDKYTIDNLSKADVASGTITIESLIDQDKDFSSYLFSMKFDPTLAGGEEKTTTGLMNVPEEDGPFPIIVMLRGYVDQKTYKTGVGTQRAGQVFAKNGFITVAPDFLGYAGGSPEAGNIFESRFQTYTTVMTLLKSINSLSFAKAVDGKWDGKNIFIWAHSNGGQVALTTLAITGDTYPTVLWAPVTKYFPYSILFYTDESDDGGKFIRSELAKFEDLYDSNLYSFTNYLDRIKAPIELHQGTADDAVDPSWSDAFYKKMKNLEDDITYFKYPGSDHNLMPAWNTVIERNLSFYQKHLVK